MLNERSKTLLMKSEWMLIYTKESETTYTFEGYSNPCFTQIS